MMLSTFPDSGQQFVCGSILKHECRRSETEGLLPDGRVVGNGNNNNPGARCGLPDQIARFDSIDGRDVDINNHHVRTETRDSLQQRPAIFYAANYFAVRFEQTLKNLQHPFMVVRQHYSGPQFFRHAQ
jgi:hypothetical protein